ncbi:universal stress protein [Amycolatopsis taiwanensis]|uniref:universal stress protein n=1 Tax=Amycolatopsis taiwanensis TaxID=342230 RepID=UPI0004854039|nr:universal stress protein [Amycolatopsis taiwanensis]
MTGQRKIVVGVDGSNQSEAALRWALEEATAHSDQVRAVLVRARAELLPGTSYAIQPYGRRPVGEDEEYSDRLRTTVQKVRETLDNPPPVIEAVLNGDPAAELVKESAHADLLVIGSHGARLRDVLIGSVAVWCVRHAHCPVLVITNEAAQQLG